MFGIIVNPVSGGGKNARIAQKLVEILEQRGLSCTVFETECVNDGDHQVRAALQSGCDAIVCIGGDGTISEIVQAMTESEATLYIVPCGTGNDFAHVFGLPKDPIEAFLRQLDGEPARIDCGSVNGKAFINISGSGFDVEVLRKTEELKSVYPGGKAYSKAVLAVLSSYRAFEAEISIDGSAFRPLRSTIIEIANGQYFGGGMRVAPQAQLQDGLFDVIMVDRVPSMLIPFLLPLFKLGIHLYLPVARMMRAQTVVLRSKGMVVNIDGRLEENDQAVYQILPGALKMMRPKTA